MTGKQLKNSILQLAIQGKLVPQDANDEPASVLLQRIRKEKEELVKQGKLKKKDLVTTPISDEEKPFEIPETWEWCRLGEISTYASTKKKINASEAETSLWGLDLEDIEKGGRLLCCKSVGERKAIGDKTFFKQGNILYSKLRPYLLKVLIAHKDGICTPEIIPFDCFCNISHEYIVHLLKSAYVDDYINSVTFGIKMPRVSTDTMTNLAIPLPPLSEQHRIVAKIEELMPLVEEYDKAQTQLDALNQKLPEALKKSILQEAIMGKLVPQDPNDEPASVLLQRIRKEKEQLVKDGKLKKKDLVTTPISDEEKPFEIPETWEWVRLRQITEIKSSKRVFEKDYCSQGIPFFRSKEIGDLSRGEDIVTELFISEQHYRMLKDKYGQPQKDDILITSVGSIGNTWICDGRDFYYKDGNITQLCHNTNFYSKYVEICLHSSLFYDQIRSKVAGTAYSALTIVKLNNIFIPLPPLSEQHRIVAKIEELFALLK